MKDNERSNENRTYSIGEVSSICKVSTKTLRFYDEIQILSPDSIGENGYRYYSKDSLLDIPIIKYYKQMGFKLCEMRDFINGDPNTYAVIEKAFKQKIEQLKKEEKEIYNKYTSVKDWHDLIIEARMVIENKAVEVGVRYFETDSYCFQDQIYNPNYKEAIINIEFNNYIASIGNEITGPVIIYYNPLRAKMDGSVKNMRMLQKTVMRCSDDRVASFGGRVMLTCYHIGRHDSITDTYEKMLKWAYAHHYKCGDGVYERYVTDYWTTGDVSKHVTQVIMEISR
jgi:DNA-binding transcriptional MerR regulator